MRSLVMLVPVVVGGALAGCGGGAGPHAPGNRAGGAGGTLADALASEVGAGRSVAIVGGTDGVRAVSSDGARTRTLVAGPVSWLVVDQRGDVAWFGSPDTTEIRAIDLDAPAAAPIEVHTVVTGLPDGNRVSMVGPTRYEILYPERGPDESEGEAWMTAPTFSTSSPWDMNRASIGLGIEPTPSVAGSSGYLQDSEWEAEVPKAQIADRAFLATLLARPSREVAGDPQPPETHLDGVDPANCEEAADCGRAQPIVGTRFWRVMTTNLMGDVRHIGWQLYDTDAKRLLDDEWAGWLQSVWVAPDHSAFIVAGIVVRFEGGPVAATRPDDAAIGGGWLRGGTYYD